MHSLEGLTPHSSATSAAPAAIKRPKYEVAASVVVLGNDQATWLSLVRLIVAESGVRTDKVAAVQAALATGTYNVPASAVASKVLDEMLVPCNKM